ncbi:MAG: zf-HC2 domain-containing protein [Capsulimonas sp.]|uniref:anti-sigma factor family protein n=1 Tax=Capsulimonas sp. TaxID=2494211 RepID=UPI0032632318
MNCAQAQTYIQESLDGILSSAQREALDAHLAVCPVCTDHWREYRQLSRAATQWVQEPVSVSSDFTFRLMAKIEERAASAQPSRPALWRQAAFAVVAAIAIFGLSWALYPQLMGVKVAATGIVLAPPPVPVTTSTLWESVRDLPASVVALQSAIPTSAWILPACLIALAANLALIQYARRRTA